MSRRRHHALVRITTRRLDLGVDLFNFLNIDSITGRDTAFNITSPNQSNWLRPTQIQSARFAKFYVQLDF